MYESIVEFSLCAFAFVLGAVFGSFLNVVIHRLPRGLSLIRPGSRCPHCETPILAWQNIPVLSWLLLRGRCAACEAPISPRYPLVELLTALFSAALMLRLLSLAPISSEVLDVALPFAFLFYLVFTLLAVVFIDAQTFTIPGLLVTPGIAVGVIGAIFSEAYTGVSFRAALYGAALGGASLLLIALSFLFIRRKEGMGEGDILLVMFIGAYLGPLSLLFVFLASSVQGLLFTGAFWRRVQEQGLRIPFGPFLALSALEWLFFSDTILHRFDAWSALL